NTAAAWLLQAMALRVLGRPVEAVSAIDQALERSPEWDDALYERGLCHSQSGDHAAAIGDFDRLLEQGTLSSPSIKALTMKRRSLETLGESAAARSCEATVMAYVALNEQRDDDAMQFLRKALETDHKNANASFRLGALLMEHGTLEEAAEEMARGLELRPR